MTIATGEQPTVVQVTQRIDFHTYGDDAPIVLLKPDNYYGSRDRPHTLSRVQVKRVTHTVDGETQRSEDVSVYVRMRLIDGSYSGTEKLLKDPEEHDVLTAVIERIVKMAHEAMAPKEKSNT